HPGLLGHGDGDRLALDLVGLADAGGLGHLLVIDEGGFDLYRGDPVTGDVHDVVHAAEEPEVAVLVDLGAVAGEVDVVVLGPVLLDEAIGVAPDAAQHAGPRLADDEIAGLGRPAALVEHGGVDAGKRLRRGAGLEHRHAGQRRDENVARLGLPPRVHHRALAVPDHLPVPDPRLRVD